MTDDGHAFPRRAGGAHAQWPPRELDHYIQAANSIPVLIKDHRRHLHDGLVGDAELVGLDRVAQVALELQPAHGLPCMRPSKTSWRPLPPTLARYIATSASRSSSGGARRGRRARCRSTPRRTARGRRGGTGAARSRMRSAITVASRGVAARRAGPRTRRRPGGRRCRRGAGPLQAARDRAAVVAGEVAQGVVDELEAVEVQEQHGRAGRRCGAARGGSPASRRSRNSTRFGRPVSASCSASCRRRSSASRRSVTSVCEPARRVAPPLRSRTARPRRASSGSSRRGAGSGVGLEVGSRR